MALTGYSQSVWDEVSKKGSELLGRSWEPPADWGASNPGQSADYYLNMVKGSEEYQNKINGGSSGSSEINIPEGAYPKSYSGPQQWLQDYGKTFADKYGTSFTDQVNSVLSKLSGASPYEEATRGLTGDLTAGLEALKGAPNYIEQTRTALPKEFLASQQPFDDYVRPAIENMNSRGILNSSVTGGALAAAVNERLRAYNAVVQNANTSASQMMLNHLQTYPGLVEQGMSSLNNLDKYWLQKEATKGNLAAMAQGGLNSLLSAAGRYGESSDEWAPWATMAPILTSALFSGV